MTTFTAEDIDLHADEIVAVRAACAAGDGTQAIMQLISETFMRGYAAGVEDSTMTVEVEERPGEVA